MRRFLPLAAGLGLLLVATSALASGVLQGTNRRTDLMGDRATQRVESNDALSTTRDSRGGGLVTPIEAPRQPVAGSPGLLDLELSRGPVDVQSVREAAVQRDVSHVNAIADAVSITSITEGPSGRLLREGRRGPTALVAHGVSEHGGEVIFTAGR